MDEATFQRELSKYKVVRKADHYKLRYKKQEKKAVTDSRATATASSPEKKSVAAATGDFWDILSAGPRAGLNASEWTKFVSSMKQSQPQIIEILNLEDLESLASYIQ